MAYNIWGDHLNQILKIDERLEIDTHTPKTTEFGEQNFQTYLTSLPCRKEDKVTLLSLFQCYGSVPDAT